ncbi:MAG: hypothetical protein Q8K86_11515 [Candidatus Nanopelagicaceae bacterium]|nr:hypothetical protein [Candidatus Nanopelagicaceae bacterium]
MDEITKFIVLQLDEVKKELRLSAEINRHLALFNEILHSSEYADVPKEQKIFRSELNSGVTVALSKEEIEVAIKTLMMVTDIDRA